MRRTLLMMLLGFSVSAPAAELARTISVAGQGKVSAAPDIVYIRTGVTTESREAQAALAENSRAMQRLLALLQQRGVADRDVRTTNFSVEPIAKRNKPSTGVEFSGYRVDNQVHVRLQDVEQLGEILDALVAAGSNRVAGIEFALRDPARILEEARKQAIADARARAEVYADSAGVRVGSVISISEHSAQAPRPQTSVRHMALEQASTVPVAPGMQEVLASVTVVYALLD